MNAKILLPVLAIALAITLGSCGKPIASDLQIRPAVASAAEPPPKPNPKPALPKRVSKRKGNTTGKVMVLEYHRIVAKDTLYDRSVKKFKQDLQLLYERGYRPVTLSQYLDNKIDVPPGAIPVVFTFDDSDPSQFRFLEDGTLDPTCAVGIWSAFAEKYPDFPVRATFYVLPNGPFGQKKLRDKKLQMLKDWGCELASHTWNHKSLGKLTDEQVCAELGKSIEWIRGLGFEPRHLALPYGVMPRNRALLKSFKYNGKTYGFQSVALAGAGPALAPTDERLDPMRLPRIQGMDRDLGIRYWLEMERKMKVAFYVQP